ncbi:hypothetical protein [Enterocloster lavalensis]|mgnify:CR=1 FL=1|uniref:hypothetical protein n=1 Tax=Enterocloster lavalensis TaxID=460384 RepID=UPI000D198680|nr:hypothetical protein [Enterocloster lavalensis]PST28460.1 hypothetical protein C7256_29155 [Enterocloster lavalensis]
MNLEKLLKDGLKVPSVSAFAPIIPPCFTWNRITEDPGLTGNGGETETVVQLQIDVWGRKRGDVVNMARLAKRLIVAEPYTTVPVISYGYDVNGKLWRGTINFSNIEEDENGSK